MRFIPAYAGNSIFEAPRIVNNAVHPRLRGELYISCYTTAHNIGSSPLTRGTLAIRSLRISRLRFIPAYAGNSLRPRLDNWRRAVHPRLRGELFLLILRAVLDVGSSPLTRGTRFCPQRRSDLRRFIPAYAGNSRSVIC